MKRLTNPITGKIIKNTTASYKPITQIIEHFWSNTHKIKPTKSPLQPPVYFQRRVYKD